MLKERLNSENNIEWQDIVDLRTNYYGIAENRDNVRKGGKLINEYLQAGWNLMPPDSNNKSVDDKIAKLRSERRKNQATAIELNRLNRQHDRFELFYNNIRDAIPVLPVPRFTYKSTESTNNTQENEYLLTIADIHAGANFKSENNEYSLSICEQRFNKLLNKMIEYVQSNDITKLNILELGDTIQGLIHINDVKINETSVVEAVVYVSKLLAQFLNELSDYCSIDYYHVPSANHTQMRCLGTKANELASEDLEYIIANYIKDSLVNNPNVCVHTNFGHEYIEVPIYNFNIIALHGHQIKNVNGSIKDLSFIKHKLYDYVILGHYHAVNNTTVAEGISNDVEVLVCPSFIGSDIFADKIMRGSKAACSIFTFDADKGHIRTDKIILN